MRKVVIAVFAHVFGAFAGVTAGIALLEWALFLAGAVGAVEAYLVAAVIGGGAGVFFGHLSWMFWRE